WPGTFLRRADVAPTTSRGWRKSGLSGGFVSRLAQYGMARRARRHQPRPDSDGRIYETPDPHLGRVQSKSVCSLHGARIRFRQPAIDGTQRSRAYTPGNQGAGGLCKESLRHDSSRAANLWTPPSHAEV